MDIGKSITYWFEDSDWLAKVAIGAGIALVGLVLSPILIGIVAFLFISGYSLGITRNVMDGVESPLPEWDDWGELLARGFKLFVIQLIWAIPLIILSVGSSVPAVLTENTDLQGPMILLSVCCGCLSVLVGIAYALIEPAIVIRFARTYEFSSGFDFAEIFQLLKDNISNIIIAAIINVVAGIALFILGLFVGTLALVIGLLVTIPVTTLLAELIKAHLYGQIGREADRTSIEPV